MISQLGQLLGASSLHHKHQVWNCGGPFHLCVFRNSPCNWQPRNDTLKSEQGQKFTLPGRTDYVTISVVCCHLKEDSPPLNSVPGLVTNSLSTSVFLSRNRQAAQIRGQDAWLGLTLAVSLPGYTTWGKSLNCSAPQLSNLLKAVIIFGFLWGLKALGQERLRAGPGAPWALLSVALVLLLRASWSSSSPKGKNNPCGPLSLRASVWEVLCTQ